MYSLRGGVISPILFIISFFSTRNYNNVEHFISFVDHVLIRSTCSKINKFQLEFHHIDWEFDSKISEWLNFAVEKKAEDVGCVTYPYDEDLSYELPLSMYTCSSLITLTLTSWVFDKGPAIAWNSLKSLTLHSTPLDDGDVVKLLSSCPALETMELSFCESRRLEITSSNLKKLTLSNHFPSLARAYDSLEIIAPHLKHLDISGNLGKLQYRLVNVSSLVIASLTFSISCITNGWKEDNIDGDNCCDYHQVIRNLILDHLQKLSDVTELIMFRYADELTIGTWFTEVMCMLQFKGISLPEMKCKYLTLELHVKKFNLYGIAGLLRASPHVKTLNIDISTEGLDIDISTKPLEDSHCQFELTYLAKGDDNDLQSWNSSFGFPNLKNVKIFNSSIVCFKDHLKQGFDKLLKLSEFLLKNATVLEKFMISKRIMCEICSINCVSTCLSQLAEKLLRCPRSSTNCVIIY